MSGYADNDYDSDCDYYDYDDDYIYAEAGGFDLAVSYSRFVTTVYNKLLTRFASTGRTRVRSAARRARLVLP